MITTPWTAADKVGQTIQEWEWGFLTDDLYISVFTLEMFSTQSAGKKFAQEIIVTFSPFHFLFCVLFKMTHFNR